MFLKCFFLHECTIYCCRYLPGTISAVSEDGNATISFTTPLNLVEIKIKKGRKESHVAYTRIRASVGAIAPKTRTECFSTDSLPLF